MTCINATEVGKTKMYALFTEVLQSKHQQVWSKKQTKDKVITVLKSIMERNESVDNSM